MFRLETWNRLSSPLKAPPPPPCGSGPSSPGRSPEPQTAASQGGLELKGLLGNPAEEMQTQAAGVGAQQGAGKKKKKKSLDTKEGSFSGSRRKPAIVEM